MRSLGWLLLAAVALAIPSELSAQRRDRDDDDDRRPRRIERRNDDDDWRDRRIERRQDDDDDWRDRDVVWRDHDDDSDWRNRGRTRDWDIDRRSRARDGWDRDDVIILRDIYGRIVVIDRDEFERRFRVDRRGHGPAFCRNGQGHPVHGRRWCLEKGFGLGVRNDIFDDRGRSIFRQGDQVVFLRWGDRDRGPIERIVEGILLEL